MCEACQLRLVNSTCKEKLHTDWSAYVKRENAKR